MKRLFPSPFGFILILMLSLVSHAARFSDANFSETSLATNLDGTAMQFAPDGRLFICGKTGNLRVYKDGALLAKPFIKLSVSSVSEQGLLGIAFHPAFPDSNWVYVFYTLPTKINRISRFRADGDTALGGLAGEQVLFELPTATGDNHDGGAIHFGNDGKLYISSGNRAISSAQDMTTVLGKILRLEPDGSIPGDNPFMAQTTGKAQAIYAAGIRNTFTFAIDRISGRIFGCEVGDGAEEVNEILPGSNYGYGRAEGYTLPTNLTNMVGTFRPAIHAYNGGCIIGASFYTPTGLGFPGARNFPETYHRRFFFADYNLGTIRTLDLDNPREAFDFATAANSPVDIKFSSDGVMYYLNRGSAGGSLFRVTYANGASIQVPARPRNPSLTKVMVRKLGFLRHEERMHRLNGRTTEIARPPL